VLHLLAPVLCGAGRSRPPKGSVSLPPKAKARGPGAPEGIAVCRMKGGDPTPGHARMRVVGDRAFSLFRGVIVGHQIISEVQHGGRHRPIKSGGTVQYDKSSSLLSAATNPAVL
jgi:hypothetical protein